MLVALARLCVAPPVGKGPGGGSGFTTYDYGLPQYLPDTTGALAN